MKMSIESFNMPDHIDDGTEALRALSIYAQVRPEVDINNPDERERLLEDFDDQDIFVARDDEGSIVGVTSFYLPKNEDYLYLSGIAVSRSAQGLGVGANMMQRLIEIAKNEGRIAIEGESLPTAETFYARMGAVAIGGRIRHEFN